MLNRLNAQCSMTAAISIDQQLRQRRSLRSSQRRRFCVWPGEPAPRMSEIVAIKVQARYPQTLDSFMTVSLQISGFRTDEWTDATESLRRLPTNTQAPLAVRLWRV